MATDFRVVTPDDMGNTIRLGAKEANKYDIDVGQLDLPEQITALTLEGTTLRATSAKGDKTVDLAPMLPKIAADTFLKNVQRATNYIKFTVGQKDSDEDNTEFQIDISDFIASAVDEQTLSGDGTTGSALAVKIDPSSDNLITKSEAGLNVARDTITRVAQEAVQHPVRDIRLTNASGQTVIGYLHSTEQ